MTHGSDDLNKGADLSSYSMLDLFRLEAETQTGFLTQGLLALEADPAATQQIEVLMRAAHSLKGAARMVGLGAAVRVAHAMEDSLVAAQREERGLSPQQVDVLLQGVDLLTRIAGSSEAVAFNWEQEHRDEIEDFFRKIARAAERQDVFEQPSRTSDSVAEHAGVLRPYRNDDLEHQAHPAISKEPVATDNVESINAPEPEAQTTVTDGTVNDAAVSDSTVNEAATNEAATQAVRVSAENLNQLLGLAGESVVASRWLDTFTAEMMRFKRVQGALTKSLQGLQEVLIDLQLDERVQHHLVELQEAQTACRDVLSERLAELELFDRRFSNLSQRLYQEVLDSRMRPFADGTQGFPRMVRDLARTLGKEVRLAISGEATPVDRDILERVEAPLGHLLRNALDHAIETPEERERAGKARGGTILLEARHHAGMLLITVTDDGRGIDLEEVRATVVRKGLADAAVAAELSEAELLEFLFLPGFTLKEQVTEISGRGVGLDVVQTIVKEVGGTVRISSSPGAGTSFQLQLPLTLSVIRTLLVEVAGEPYAFPLSRIVSVLKVPHNAVQSIEGRQHFSYAGKQIGIVTAHQLLELGEVPLPGAELSIVVLGDKTDQYGVVIDRFLGERELVVRTLDPRLGRIQDISAAALMPDQTPVLIIDVEDLLRTIENIVSGGRLSQVRPENTSDARKRKRVLVVDDSLTVRELERKLIDSRGYEVEVAVDGMDGWNAVRTGHYDLVVTDVDMPRLDGIELVTLIKREPRLQSLPVMIVSYKDREEDRRRGLEVGADYYLTKGSFHDETLLQAVEDLIGAAEEQR